jgi:hypothetical protein
VRFEEVRAVKKPGKKATPEEQEAYREASQKENLSTASVKMFRQLREKVDELGGIGKTLVFSLDGSFCNQTIFKAQLERTILIARARKDAVLCLGAKEADLWSREIHAERSAGGSADRVAGNADPSRGEMASSLL